MLTLIAVLTVAVSWWLKWWTAGWGTISFGIPYLAAGCAHVAVHAIRGSRSSPPPVLSHVLISDGLFLLAFLLQEDFGDDFGWFTIAALPCGGPGGVSGLIGRCPAAPDWWPGGVTNLGLFVPVIGTWVWLLWRRPGSRPAQARSRP